MYRLVALLVIGIAPLAHAGETETAWVTLAASDTSFAYDPDKDRHDLPYRGPGRLFSDKLPQTDGKLDRLLSTQRLELVRLLETDSTRVFFGINRDGRFGLHLEASELLKK